MLLKAINDLLFQMMNGAFWVYDGFSDLAYKIRARHTTSWENLTRSLHPTDEDLAQEVADEQQRALIVHLNQDVSQYNAKTWWDEYNQARAYNVN